MPPSPTVAFVSGHLDATPAYFASHYVPQLDAAIANAHRFVLGASAGIDTIALSYLLAHQVPPSDVTVYLHRGQESVLRPRLADFERRGGNVVVAGATHTERDHACTHASHYDVLRYRSLDEARQLYGPKYRPRISGTEKNEQRRKAGVGLVYAAEPAPPLPARPKSPTPAEKRIRGLERKIREARVLRDRIDEGIPLEKTQLAKAAKMDEWVAELDALVRGGHSSETVDGQR